MGKKVKLRVKVILVLFFSISLILAYSVWDLIYGSNIIIESKSKEYLFIPSDSDFEYVVSTIEENKLLENTESFKWLAGVMNYPNNIHPGRYRLEKGMSNRALLLKLRKGDQDPVKIRFERLFSKHELVALFTKELDCKGEELRILLNDQSFLASYGFNSENVKTLFIPDTYYFDWNTSAHGIIDRMYKEYKKFGDKKRIRKAGKMNLTPIEVTILASIVEQETYMNDEKPKIAGVYLNRIRKGMKLQADPTIKHIAREHNIKRVLKRHLKIESPYNTYLHRGLPPGPICIPTKSSINAVLKNERHSYIFFCAKEDFSGRHNFAVTNKEHVLNARRYHKALNARKIYK